MVCRRSGNRVVDVLGLASLFLWGSNVIYQPILVRYEELDRLIQARIDEKSKDFNSNRSIAEHLQMFYDDPELLQWHAEREELRKKLFLGHAPDDFG